MTAAPKMTFRDNLSDLEELRDLACSGNSQYVQSPGPLSKWDYMYGDYMMYAHPDNFTTSIGARIDNVSSIYDNYEYDDQYGANEAVQTFGHIEKVLYTRVVVVICLLGLVGNVFNLIILIPKGLHFSMGRIEKFANSGLIALAVSDLCFCVMVVPHAFINLDIPVFPRLTFDLLYITYNNALINIFIMASTWLTVTLAIGRYLATCHPLRAREMIGMTIAKWSIFIVCFVCVLFNIPRFWTYRIEHVDCGSGKNVYFRYNGYLTNNHSFDMAFSWMYFVLGILLPLILLTFSNTYLIRALRNSRATRRLIRAGDTTETSRYITMTLVVIVIMYIALVSPAELINFLRRHVMTSQDKAYIYNLAVAVVNTLQAINFSFNFVLYCVINVSFRRSFVRLLSCGWYRTKRRRITRNRPSSWSSSYNHRIPMIATRSTFISLRLSEV